MSTFNRSRVWFAVFGAALGAGALVSTGSPAESELRVNAACPAGEVADEEETGWRCVPQCPAGMMIDELTHVCVAAPGVPPALPEVATVPTPQI